MAVSSQQFVKVVNYAIQWQCGHVDTMVVAVSNTDDGYTSGIGCVDVCVGIADEQRVVWCDLKVVEAIIDRSGIGFR